MHFLRRIRSSVGSGSGPTKSIKSPYGLLTYNWKYDLREEEDEDYLPPGYSDRVLELATIGTHAQGLGHGTELMKKFLLCPDAKKAELIFLDPVPRYGSNFDRTDDDQQIESLIRFYSRFGFRSNPKSAARRMWLVRVGKLSVHDLPM